MKQQLTNKLRGFTIIEVVLVLAIAALIFLLVFLAFPALQRNQRDTQRRNDVGRFISQLSQYQTNTAGEIPSDATELAEFKSDYLTDGDYQWGDPNSGKYDLIYNPGSEEVKVGQVLYFPKKKCDGASLQNGSARQAAILTKLEAGGVYCQDNS